MFRTNKRQQPDCDLDVDLEKPTRESQVFHFAWRFSLAHGKDLEEFKTIVLEDLKKSMVASAGPKGRFIFQLECTPRHKPDCPDAKDAKSEDDNWHYQGYLHCMVKRRPQELGSSLGSKFPGIWVARSSVAGQEALKSYCMKRDGTYRAGPWSEKGAVSVYQGEDLPKELRPWQQSILSWIKEDADDRTYNWLLDEQGGIGKSKFCKYIMYHKLGAYITFGSAKNLSKRLFDVGAKNFYCIDLPRAKPKDACMQDIFFTLEQLKNGIIQAQMYEGGEIIFKPPHVWVFSNYSPDYKHASVDRLKTWNVDRTTYKFDKYLHMDKTYPI